MFVFWFIPAFVRDAVAQILMEINDCNNDLPGRITVAKCFRALIAWKTTYFDITTEDKRDESLSKKAILRYAFHFDTVTES